METSQEKNNIEIEQETLKILNSTRKWSMFMAILGFMFVGLIIVAGVIATTFLSTLSIDESNAGFPEWLVIISIFFIAFIYFFPVLFLFRFSKFTGIAVSTLDKKELHKAFRNLKAYFVYLGILIIIVLALYISVIAFFGSTLDMLKGFR
jgi:hypothetical protein